MSTLLDTTVLIDILRGSSGAIDRVRRLGTQPLVSAISIEEVRAGMRDHERDRTFALLDMLRIVPVGREEALLSGTWRREFAAVGRSLPRSDALIAACAVTQGASVATANVKDFPMPELVVEHWPSE